MYVYIINHISILSPRDPYVTYVFSKSPNVSSLASDGELDYPMGKLRAFPHHYLQSIIIYPNEDAHMKFMSQVYHQYCISMWRFP